MRTGAVGAAVCCVLALLCAAPAARAADPFYGLFTTNLDAPAQQVARTMDAQAATGAGLLREHVYWDQIELRAGVFDFKRLDALVARAAARGLTVLPVLTSTPQFYSAAPARRRHRRLAAARPVADLRRRLPVGQALRHRRQRVGLPRARSALPAPVSPDHGLADLERARPRGLVAQRPRSGGVPAAAALGVSRDEARRSGDGGRRRRDVDPRAGARRLPRPALRARRRALLRHPRGAPVRGRRRRGRRARAPHAGDRGRARRRATCRYA